VSKFIKIYFQSIAGRAFVANSLSAFLRASRQLSAIAATRLALLDSARYITVENPDITQGRWRAARRPPAGRVPAPARFSRRISRGIL